MPPGFVMGADRSLNRPGSVLETLDLGSEDLWIAAQPRASQAHERITHSRPPNL